MNKFVIVDPCYLEGKSEWWGSYIEQLWMNGIKQDKKLISFGALQGVVVNNPMGDIYSGQYLLKVPGLEAIQIPACDSGNHVIFNFEGIKNYLGKQELFKVFKSPLKLVDFVDNFEVVKSA